MSTFKKLFGRYKASDVDEYVAKVTQIDEEQRIQIESLSRDVDAVKKLLEQTQKMLRTSEQQKEMLRDTLEEQASDIGREQEVRSALEKRLNAERAKLAEQSAELDREREARAVLEQAIESERRKLEDQKEELSRVKAAQADLERTVASEQQKLLDQREQLDREQTISKALQQQIKEMIEKQNISENEKNGNAEMCEELKEQIRQKDHEIESARDELYMARIQIEYLTQRVAEQRKLVEQTEALLQENPLSEANEKAQKILQEAVATSQKMLDDAESVRSQALASVRAAYFNTMGFRQAIEERFASLEHELDQSMGSLRVLQMPDTSFPVTISGGKSE